MSLKNMTTRISRKHLIAVALIIAFGGVAGVFILHSGQGSSESESHAHTEEGTSNNPRFSVNPAAQR